MEIFFFIFRTLIGLIVWGACIVALTWAAGAKDWAGGFFLGWLGSLVYYLLLCRRVQKAVELPAAQAVRSMRVGWLVRLFFLLLLLLLSLKVQDVSFWASVAGLLSLQGVWFLFFVCFALKQFGLKNH